MSLPTAVPFPITPETKFVGDTEANLIKLGILMPKQEQPYGFPDMTEWGRKNPGTNQYTCEYCGMYQAGAPQCNRCELDNPDISTMPTPNPSRLHLHLDHCERCREQPFNLCPTGDYLIKQSVWSPDASPTEVLHALWALYPGATASIQPHLDCNNNWVVELWTRRQPTPPAAQVQFTCVDEAHKAINSYQHP